MTMTHSSRAADGASEYIGRRVGLLRPIDGSDQDLFTNGGRL